MEPDHMTRPLRIVHAAQFHLDKCGARYFSSDMKFHQGMVRLGHLVFPYSVNDVARMHSPFNSKPWGRRSTNRDLIKTCINVKPDLLMLGHAQSISLETLLACRKAVPDMKVALWYIDPLWERKDTEHIYRRRGAIDAIFVTSAGPLLADIATPGCPTAFIPNPVDPSIETGRNFELPADEIEYDLIFFGADKREPERRRFLETLYAGLNDRLRLGIFGSLGNPFIYGDERDYIISHSKMALSLNRKNDILLYSSDRMAQLMGNGVLTFTPDSAGFHDLFTPEEAVYFSSADNMVEQALNFMQDDTKWRETARRGRDKIHRTCSSDVIARYMIDTVFGNQEASNVKWPVHIYQ
jgi:hypothetical protein